jgi:hypothetical protein
LRRKWVDFGRGKGFSVREDGGQEGLEGNVPIFEVTGGRPGEDGAVSGAERLPVVDFPAYVMIAISTDTLSRRYARESSTIPNSAMTLSS